MGLSLWWVSAASKRTAISLLSLQQQMLSYWEWIVYMLPFGFWDCIFFRCTDRWTRMRFLRSVLWNTIQVSICVYHLDLWNFSLQNSFLYYKNKSILYLLNWQCIFYMWSSMNCLIGSCNYKISLKTWLLDVTLWFYAKSIPTHTHTESEVAEYKKRYI